MADPWAEFKPAASDPYAEFKPAAAAKPGVVEDVAKALPSGVARGAAETAMLPATAEGLMSSGADWLFDKGDNLVRSIFGVAPFDPEQRAKDRAAVPNLQALPQAARRGMDATLYKAQTTPGEYADTIGQFIGGGGGVPSLATRGATTGARMAGEYAADVSRQAVIPALFSETAGQFTGGNPYAEAAGALVGGGVGSLGKIRYAPEATVRRALPENMTEADWQRAIGLQGNRFGVGLTGPESITQAMDGLGSLPVLGRVVESSIEGGQRMNPLFRDRPDQIATAYGGIADQIAPAGANPYTLGPRMNEAATEVIDGERRAINAQTRPSYQAAEPVQVPTVDTTAPAYQAVLADLRANRILGPEYANMPDDSVAVIDAVTRNMRDRGLAMGAQTNPGMSTLEAARLGEGARTARNEARATSPEYDTALTEQEALRRTVLDPLEQGPVGAISRTTDTRQAGSELLPPKPLPGAAPPIGDAATRLFAQDPETTAALVRNNLDDRFATAMNPPGTSTTRQTVGTRFHNDLVGGTPEKAQVLDNVLQAIQRPNAATDITDFMDVLEATSRRLPPNSATAANTEAIAGMKEPGMFRATWDVARTAGIGAAAQARAQADRVLYRNAMTELGDAFAAPDAVERLRQMQLRGAPTVLPEILARTGAQLPAMFSGR